MSMDTARHDEALADGTTFAVDGYPANWSELGYQVKLAWLQGHTSPKCTYTQACAILGMHRATQLRANHEHARERAAAVKRDHPTAAIELAKAEALPVQFGKHNGKTLGEIAAVDLMYLDWMAGQTWLRGTLLDGVLALCARHAREIERRIQ